MIKFNLLKTKRGDVIKFNADTYFCFRGILWTKLDDNEVIDLERQLNPTEEEKTNGKEDS